MVEMMLEPGAKYLFLAFGTPKQDGCINEHVQEMRIPVCAGIGGVLNLLAGDVKRASEWVQQPVLEWLYRISQEPTHALTTAWSALSTSLVLFVVAWMVVGRLPWNAYSALLNAPWYVAWKLWIDTMMLVRCAPGIGCGL